MRKNCQRTVNAWRDGKSFGKRGDSIWTDGDAVYSYATWIVCPRKGGPFLFNATKYSQTTTTHQNALRAYMEGEGLGVEVYDNEPRGTSYKL